MSSFHRFNPIVVNLYLMYEKRCDDQTKLADVHERKKQTRNSFIMWRINQTIKYNARGKPIDMETASQCVS